MTYYNVITREIKEFSQEEFELENIDNQWIEYNTTLNKIVITSINNYKIFPKDELGLNASKIIPLLKFYKPLNKESALKIAKYYNICPYCLSKFNTNDSIIFVDCREHLDNINKMQLDIYTEVACCYNTYLIPFGKTKSTIERANFIKNALEQDKNIIVSYKIKSINIEILIDLIEIFEINLNNDYEIMQKILNDNLYLDIRKTENSDYHLDVSDNLKKEILNYLKIRR